MKNFLMMLLGISVFGAIFNAAPVSAQYVAARNGHGDWWTSANGLDDSSTKKDAAEAELVDVDIAYSVVVGLDNDLIDIIADIVTALNAFENDPETATSLPRQEALDTFTSAYAALVVAEQALDANMASVLYDITAEWDEWDAAVVLCSEGLYLYSVYYDIQGCCNKCDEAWDVFVQNITDCSGLFLAIAAIEAEAEELQSDANTLLTAIVDYM